MTMGEVQMATLTSKVTSQLVIAGRTNSSFHGLNNIMMHAPSLIITKEQVNTTADVGATAVEKTFYPIK